jgi:hypothetical protein
MSKIVSVALLRRTFASRNYTWDPALNLVGIRSSLVASDLYNDLFVLHFLQPVLPPNLPVAGQQAWLNSVLIPGTDGKPLVVDGQAGPQTRHALAEAARLTGSERHFIWTITTEAGAYYSLNPLSPKGVAVLVPDQYRNAYQLGLHQRKAEHPALVQTGAKVKVFRDNDRDGLAEEQGEIEEGFFGINIHRAHASLVAEKIGKHSAGCQVFRSAGDFSKLLSVLGAFKTARGNRFTYTLLRENELV